MKVTRRRFVGAAASFAGAGAAQEIVRYPDERVKVVDPRFAPYRINNTALARLHTGTLWAEGPAWNAVGRYLVWSDIPNDVQLRYLDEDGHVSLFRRPSGNSNGNTFDDEGRQLSCEHGGRRVVRYEHDGTTTIIADAFRGKPLNAPNDVVVHPEDGSIWFTDPGYGSLGDYEGQRAELLLDEAVYRVDVVTGMMEVMTTECEKPNGLCFSPDYRRLYVADTGASPRDVKVFDVVDGRRLGPARRFVSMAIPGVGNGGADGIRCDVDGNLWAAAGWGGEGYDGVHVFAPDGTRIGQILLPEVCANLCFGGAKGNRLFMTASQSLYALYVGVRGAHFG